MVGVIGRMGRIGRIGSSRPVQGGGFSLAAFMAAQSDGFWYDFSQTDRLFQENVGPTPADEPNEVIGLALSSRLWGGKSLAAYLAEQPELVTNGEFVSDLSGWDVTASTAPSTIIWSAGKALAQTNGAASARLRAGFPTVAGRTYALTVEGTMSFSLGTVSGAADVFPGVNPATRPFLIFTAMSGTTWIGAVTSTNGHFLERISVKEVSRYAATQATASFKPKWQATGAAFDGLDDRHQTGYAAAAGPHFMVCRATIQATVSGIVGLIGSTDTSNANRCYLGVSAEGFAAAGIGAVSAGTIKGGASLLGRDVVIGVTNDGSTVRVFADGVEVYSGAQSGAVTTTTPFAIGAINAPGGPGFFTSSAIRRALVGRQFIDLATFNQIAAGLNA